jgi:hypothetical protein
MEMDRTPMKRLAEWYGNYGEVEYTLATVQVNVRPSAQMLARCVSTTTEWNVLQYMVFSVFVQSPVRWYSVCVQLEFHVRLGCHLNRERHPWGRLCRPNEMSHIEELVSEPGQ